MDQMLSQNPTLPGPMLGSDPAACSVLGHLKPIISRKGLTARVQKANKQRHDRRKPSGSCVKTRRTVEAGVTPFASMRSPHLQRCVPNLPCPCVSSGLPRIKANAKPSYYITRLLSVTT